MIEKNIMRLPTRKFPSGYTDEVFAIWYDAGKPVSTQLHQVIPEYEILKERPTPTTLREWMKAPEWIERAEQLDAETKRNLDEHHVLSKVEMFERHAEVGREMQRISLTWLKANEKDLSPGTAVRMLVDGIEIEQGAAGIPDALKKMMNMKDEDLKAEIAQLLADAPTVDADNN